MGQQQLILLALAVVIVGAAIVVGIRAFSENNVRNNHDTMMQDAVRAGNDLQAWKQKPAPFGGQAACSTPTVVQDPNDFACGTFARLGYTPAGAADRYDNLNGQFKLVVASTDSTAIVSKNVALQNEVVIGITGLTDGDISGATVCLGGQKPDGTGACTVAAF